MMQDRMIIWKIIVEPGNETAWSERWNARLITRFYNAMLNIEQSDAKHNQAFFGFVGYCVHTETLYLNSSENDEYFERPE